MAGLFEMHPKGTSYPKSGLLQERKSRCYTMRPMTFQGQGIFWFTSARAANDSYWPLPARGSREASLQCFQSRIKLSSIGDVTMLKHAATLGLSIISGLLFAVGSAAFGVGRLAGVSPPPANVSLLGFLMLGIAVCIEARIWHRLARVQQGSRGHRSE